MDPRAVPKRFAADEAELGALGLQLKQWRCPHCGREGALIGHGWLRGYAEHGGEGVIRGRRVFCSNRFRRGGCGHVLGADRIGLAGIRGARRHAVSLRERSARRQDAQGGVAVCGRGGAIGVERIPAVAAAGSGASVAPSAAVPAVRATGLRARRAPGRPARAFRGGVSRRGVRPFGVSAPRGA